MNWLKENININTDELVLRDLYSVIVKLGFVKSFVIDYDIEETDGYWGNHLETREYINVFVIDNNSVLTFDKSIYFDDEEFVSEMGRE